MSDATEQPQDDLDEAQSDSRADTKAILIIFITAVVFAVHYVSGFSFDF
ncbi:MAG: hypothetical protein AAF993_20250 [Pseudomonadota bacterium]